MLLVLRHAQKKIISQCRSRVSRIAEENSEPCQISKIKRFSKIVTYASELRSLSLLLLFIFVICWTIVIFALTCETFWETSELVSFWLVIWKATTLEEKYLANGYFLDIYRASAESLISETLVNRCFLQKNNEICYNNSQNINTYSLSEKSATTIKMIPDFETPPKVYARLLWSVLICSQPAITCLKLTTETLDQGVKCVQS